jgi:transposase
MLQTIQNNISRIEQTIAEIDSQITIMTEEYQEIIELLETIPGVGHDGAIGIIAEISLDMDKFPSS